MTRGGTMAWSLDGQKFAFSSQSQYSVWVWDRGDGSWTEWDQDGYDNLGMAWQPDGRLFKVSHRPTRGIYDVLTGEFIRPLDHWVDGVGGPAVWAADGKNVAVFFDLGGVVMDVTLNQRLFGTGSFAGYSWSPDGRYFATVRGSNSLWVWDAHENEVFLNDHVGQEMD